MGNIFVVAACTAGKGIGKVASFVGKIFVVKPPTTKTMHEYFAPRKLHAIRYIVTILWH